jgi:hypothetical protein
MRYLTRHTLPIDTITEILLVEDTAAKPWIPGVVAGYSGSTINYGE